MTTWFDHAGDGVMASLMACGMNISILSAPGSVGRNSFIWRRRLCTAHSNWTWWLSTKWLNTWNNADITCSALQSCSRHYLNILHQNEVWYRSLSKWNCCCGAQCTLEKEVWYGSRLTYADKIVAAFRVRCAMAQSKHRISNLPLFTRPKWCVV